MCRCTCVYGGGCLCGWVSTAEGIQFSRDEVAGNCELSGIGVRK